MYRWDETSAREDGEADRLLEPRSRPEARVFQSLTVSAARALVAEHADRAGMEASRRNDLVLAASEIAANSVLHAEGWGTLRVWREGGSLVCEVADTGRLERLRSASPAGEPEQVDGYGLWLARRLCERVEVHPLPGGTVVRLRMPL